MQYNYFTVQHHLVGDFMMRSRKQAINIKSYQLHPDLTTLLRKNQILLPLQYFSPY